MRHEVEASHHVPKLLQRKKAGEKWHYVIKTNDCDKDKTSIGKH